MTLFYRLNRFQVQWGSENQTSEIQIHLKSEHSRVWILSDEKTEMAQKQRITIFFAPFPLGFRAISSFSARKHSVFEPWLKTQTIPDPNKMP